MDVVPSGAVTIPVSLSKPAEAYSILSLNTENSACIATGREQQKEISTSFFFTVTSIEKLDPEERA